MIKRLLDKMGYVKKPEPVEVKPERPRQTFSTEDVYQSMHERTEMLWEKNFKPLPKGSAGIAMDSKSDTFAMDNNLNVKIPFNNNEIIPPAQLLWYAGQTFIGYQLCAMLDQQWLISKCCLMPAKDAVRNGYEVTINDGEDFEGEHAAILDDIRKADVKYHINKNLIEFIQMGRVFGIRVAMFIVDSDDPDYYVHPFNPDGVMPGSYRGISQIDPYWITPQLSAESSGNPAAIDFYEPTWWIINGKPIHRTHLVIFKTEEVADILKPTYIFGGIPIPQKIAERVYAAERIANEAPMLALTKRTDVINIDLAQAAAQPGGVVNRIQQWVYNRDNYGIKTLGLDEDMKQFDTSLTDLDAVIMTQYQLVAAASNVPATKLMGTSPKGFNATGEFEEASYHEELESLQCHDLTPLLDRHHLLLIRSEIAPRYNLEPFNTTITWKPVDAMTAEELAALNKLKAETGQVLITSGAIDGNDERGRIIADPESGYSGMEDEEIEIEETGVVNSNPSEAD
jgi:phage-related protein (TIGR01555 family)